ncbi:hypothetical protein A5724_29495 [Mycobacterium sp. ACS1612]|nr:hypothetical protein A5724_29495 [Mycobacterium sp. ACS1612]
MRFRILGVESLSPPALYRTRVTHLRRAPTHHYFEHHSYHWYVDVDDLPRLPRWLRPFARFLATDHLDGAPDDSLRQRIDTFLATHGVDSRDGRITAVMAARVLGYAFNPLTLYWCHDANGAVRHVVAEVHHMAGSRHAYLLPPEHAAMVRKKVCASPFTGVDGYYLVSAPLPDGELDVRISLHRENQPALVATLRGSRRRAGVGMLLWLQVAAPLAPLMGALGFRVQTMILRLRGVPAVRTTENHSGSGNFASTVAKSRMS